MIKRFAPYAAIAAVIVLVALISTKFNFLYMSKMDYLSQHSVFPDYFRKLFYDTHQLFPSYAFNIGAGQNIYNFSYYGLLNPIILLSYLFPFVEMSVYLMVATVLLQIASGCLIYRLLLNIGSRYPLLLSLLFVLATSITFHSHRHWMFVSYMPFLILALHGVEKYIKSGKSWLYLISVFLIIMTSYYYIFPCVIVLILYYLYRYGGMSPNPLRQTFSFVIKMLIPLLMSMVLILPTFFILFVNREVGGGTDILQLLIPDFKYNGLLYSPYGLGLIGLFAIALIDNLLAGTKRNRCLSIALLLFLTWPILQYILNGTLYAEPKVLIPFIPLFLLLAEETLRRFNPNRTLPILTVLTVLILLNRNHVTSTQVALIAELCVSMVILYLYVRSKQTKLLYLFVAIAFLGSVNMGLGDTLVTKAEYDDMRTSDFKTDEFVRQNDTIDSIANANYIPYIGYYNDSIYSSLINRQYVQLHNKTINSPHSSRNNATFNNTDNIIMETLMGVKYVRTETPGIGFEKCADETYVNKHVLPLGYVNSNLVSAKSLEALHSAYRSDVLINQVAVDDKTQPAASSAIKKINLNYKLVDHKHMKIKGNTITAEGHDSYLKVKIDKNLKEQILFLNIKLKRSKLNYRADQKIWVNGVLNTQTRLGWKYDNGNNANDGFNYVLSNIDKNELILYLEKGVYEIKDINTYVLGYDKIKGINQKIDKFNISSIKGDVIQGDIQVKKEGYFVFQTPYDKNYNIFVNGKQIKYEKVNGNFIGFKLDPGIHKVKIEYQAAGLKMGIFLSFVGILLYFVLWYLERRNFK